MRTIKLNSIHHLGDNIFNFILFYNIKNYIEQNDIFIDYHCKKEYHDQIKEFNCSENIKILDYENIGLDFWIGNKDNKINYFNTEDKYDTFYVKYFNQFLEKENIPIVLEKLEYTDPELLQRYENINKKFDNKYAELDFLIVNSTPLSTQYDKNVEDWNRLIYKLNDKYKIATSEKVEDVNCTMDDKLTVKDIAAISTRAKRIIAVNSGVVPGLFNIYTLNNVEVIYSFSKYDKYEHSKFVNKEDINELYSLLENDIEKFETINNSTFFINYLLLFFFIILLLIFFNYKNKYYKKIINYIKKYIILIILIIFVLFFIFYCNKKEYFIDETNKTDDIKIFITHYTKLVDRKQHVLDMFHKHNIKNYEFIEKYDQEDISDDDKNKFIVNYKKSAMSLFLKHIYIYREISNKYNHALIFEDDIFLDENFINNLNKYIVELPQDYDMLFIGNCSDLHIDENLLINDKHIYEKSNEKTHLNGSSKCCDSYLVSKKCAIKLCEYMDNLKDKIELPIDHWINDVSRYYNFKVYWAEPTIVSQGSLDGRFQSSLI
jgi:glycosyl transferase family 25